MIFLVQKSKGLFQYRGSLAVIFSAYYCDPTWLTQPEAAHIYKIYLHQTSSVSCTVTQQPFCGLNTWELLSQLLQSQTNRIIGTLHRSIMIKTLNTLFSPQNELLYFVQLTGVLQDGKETEQYKKIPLLTNYYMTHAIKKNKKIQQQKYPSKVS